MPRPGNHAADELGIGLDRLRLPGEIALHLVAALQRQERELAFGLDALGENRNVQAVPERDDGAHDRHRMVIIVEIANEDPVDLDLLEREGVQVGQRRISRSEIIERDMHAEQLQLTQDRHCAREGRSARLQ